MPYIPEPRLARPGAKKPKPKPKPYVQPPNSYAKPYNPTGPITGDPLAGLNLGALSQYLTPDLLQMVSGLIQQSVSPMAKLINDQAGGQIQSMQGFAQAAANQSAQAAPRIQDAYAGASTRTATFGKGFADGLKMIENQSAGQANDFLAQQGSPQTVAGDQGGADVLYGVGGYIPASSMEREGAAYTAAAAMQPQNYLNQSILDQRGVRAQANQALQQLLAQAQGQTGDLLSNFINLGMQARSQKVLEKQFTKEFKAKNKQQAWENQFAQSQQDWSQYVDQLKIALSQKSDAKSTSKQKSTDRNHVLASVRDAVDSLVGSIAKSGNTTTTTAGWNSLVNTILNKIQAGKLSSKYGFKRSFLKQMVENYLQQAGFVISNTPTGNPLAGVPAIVAGVASNAESGYGF